MPQPRIIAYTDGGCRGNPGPGAWAFVLIDTASGKAFERAGGEAMTTNNRMELSAALEALRALNRDGVPVEIRSDSRYTIDCCSQWMAGWKARGWTKKGGPLKNLDLLQELDAIIPRHTVSWRWVEGHAGEPGNEHVDALLNQAMDRIQRGGTATHQQRLQWQHRL